MHDIKIESLENNILTRKSELWVFAIIFLINILITFDYSFGELVSQNDIVENKSESRGFDQSTFNKLSNLDEKIPPNFWNWFGYLTDWLDASLISEMEFYNAIDFLKKMEIIKQNPNEIKEIFLTTKIKKETFLTLVDFSYPRFNEGDPIVFEGKLTDYLGNFLPNGSILIKSDGPCPSDHIIAKGITDKVGRYKIFTKTLLWDETDGMITVFAAFNGTSDLEPSSSDSQLVIVYPVRGEKCTS